MSETYTAPQTPTEYFSDPESSLYNTPESMSDISDNEETTQKFGKNEHNNNHSRIPRASQIPNIYHPNFGAKNVNQENSTKNSISQRSSLILKEKQKVNLNNMIQTSTTTSIRRRPSKNVIGRTPSKRITTIKRSGANIRKGTGRRRIMEKSTTSNPKISNDPTDMEADTFSFSQPLRFPWIPGSSSPPRLIHASLVPLSQHNKRLPVKNDTSRSTNFGRATRLILQTCNLRRPNSSLMSPDSINLSLNETRKIGKRSSQIFRRQLLEQSITMSFGGIPPNRNLSQSRQPIRRRTRKRRNDNTETAETAKTSVKIKTANTSVNNVNNKPIKRGNTVVSKRILNSEELGEKVDEELKKINLFSPQPPPRNTKNPEFPELNPIHKEMNNKSLFSQLPEKRSIKSANTTDMKDYKNSIAAESSTSLPYPSHLSSLKFSPPNNRPSRIPKFATGPPSIFSMTPTVSSPIEEFDILSDFDKPTITDQRINQETSQEINQEDSNTRRIMSPLITDSPINSSPIFLRSPTSPSKTQRLFNMFCRRDNSTPSISVEQSLPATPKSMYFGFSPRSPQSLTSTPSRSPSNTPTRSLSPVSPGKISRSASPIPNSAGISSASHLLKPGFTRHNSESVKNPIEIDKSDKSENIRKMQNFENIIKQTELENEIKNEMNIKKAMKTAIITSTTAVTSPTVIPVSPMTSSVIKKEESCNYVDGGDDNYSLYHRKNSINHLSPGHRKEDVLSGTESDQYNSVQRTFGEDKVLRMTLTPSYLCLENN
ncbi:11870_t:CDS:2 [Diversispora eburnea]|uniref:11870_t:CDS:1 n=1 Tax=Diversispora eburnea TaxID=1213867 RepID=A0A9N8YX40_9GLOM|nr:11870_t:CDS:2 [Diversispora eburnea]